MIDDSELFHGTYDPVKAREYYLKTRVLKGRRKSTASLASPGKGGRRPSAAPRVAGKANRSDTKSRRAELLAQKKALDARLDHLRDILKRKVAEAQRLSGAPKQASKSKAPESKGSKAKSGGGEKLTAAQKSEKAKAAKKAYEKEKPTSLSQDVKELQQEIKDIRARIQSAIDDAQAAQRKKAGKR